MIHNYLHKFNNSRIQYERFSDISDAHESYEEAYSEIHGKLYEEARHDDVYATHDEIQVRNRVQVYGEAHEAPRTAIAKRTDAESSNMAEVKITDYLVSIIITWKNKLVN